MGIEMNLGLTEIIIAILFSVTTYFLKQWMEKMTELAKVVAQMQLEITEFRATQLKTNNLIEEKIQNIENNSYGGATA